jgi:protein arginine N-methyltransferase 1
LDTTYNLSDYGRMLADRARMDPYAYAIKSLVGPESVVLDVGAATGIHALLACKFGAKRVYAVEPNDAIALARQAAADNGFGDRITFVQDMSYAITLPERVDLIVSDLRGVLPPFQQHIPTIADARARHLARGGALIPQRDTMWAALVEAPLLYHDLLAPWDTPYGLAMESARRVVLNTWTQEDTDCVTRRSLLTEGREWARLDYRTIEDPDVRGQIESLPVSRDGTAHGLLVWFDTKLADGIGYGNGPGSPTASSVYGRAFFPLLDPVPVAKGDNVSIAIEAEFDGEDYSWRWATQVADRDNLARLKASFEQSTDDDFDASAPTG